jgi:6-pyruvoyltetrahydropterin/6-carboxytetrahydropterin synthase
MDFGGLKEFKQWSEHMFDHTLLVAEDDPQRGALEELNAKGLAVVRVVPGVGCERFAEMAYKKMQGIINADKITGNALNPTVRVKSVEVFEHGANSAIYEE